MPAGCGVRAARVDELAELSELAFRSKAVWGYDAAFMEACRAELMIDAGYLEANPVFVLEYEGEPAGFYSLEPGAGGASGEIELGLFFLEPDMIGRGLGRAMIADAIGRARGMDACRLIVQSDPNAEGFYRVAGFTPKGFRASASLRGRELPVLEFELARP
jgi:GNAT superfamily N-acetyltransferase